MQKLIEQITIVERFVFGVQIARTDVLAVAVGEFNPKYVYFYRAKIDKNRIPKSLPLP